MLLLPGRFPIQKAYIKNHAVRGSNKPPAQATANFHVPKYKPTTMMARNGSQVFTKPHTLTYLPRKNIIVACRRYSWIQTVQE